MSLVRLACPDCGRDLTAPAGAVLFACPRCRRVSQLAGGRLANVPWTAVAPPPAAPSSNAQPPAAAWPAADPLALLPFWVFALSWRDAGLPRLPRCVVPALCPDNGSMFMKLGRALSLHPGPWPAWPGQARPACGGQLGAAEAAALAPTIALACLAGDLRRRVLEAAGEAWPIDLGPAALVFLPFTRQQRRLRDLTSGREVSDCLLGGYAWESLVVEAPALGAPATGETADLLPTR